MEQGAYPFPLAANSSHHSRYHRFLLGADPAVLAPFPKPYCLGALCGPLHSLAGRLNLQSWRKLFHGAIPWVEGFGPEHYAIGIIPPHRPLPREYGRPLRRFGAFDFVQVADPSVSALALVAGDQRMIRHFTLLANDFCARIEPGIQASHPGPSGIRATGRMLSGQFVEPNNRWLMPYLHVHARVVNFTSFTDAAPRLACLDRGALARCGERAKRGWLERQADALSDLGYRVARHGTEAQGLRVEGVPERLLAAMEAPRLAVLRILERLVLGEREPWAGRMAASMPPAVVAAMADQLESMLARSLAYHRPPKIGLPSEGPWRSAVREHLQRHCPGELALLDATAARAKAVPLQGAIFAAPALDSGHAHAPVADELDAACQLPTDPELGAGHSLREPARPPLIWLVREFEQTLGTVHDRLVRSGLDEALADQRATLAASDQLAQAADPDQLRQSVVLLGLELGRRANLEDSAIGRGRSLRHLALDDFAGCAGATLRVGEREFGGRSL
jgi:hypothetical protein